MEYYLLFLWGGVDVQLFGAFKDKDSRDNKAKELRKEHGDYCSYFPVQATKGSKIDISCYSEGFLGE